MCVKGLPNEFTTNGSECDPFTRTFFCCAAFSWMIINLLSEDLGAMGICIIKICFADDVVKHSHARVTAEVGSNKRLMSPL